jgi:hypothetical protein
LEAASKIHHLVPPQGRFPNRQIILFLSSLLPLSEADRHAFHRAKTTSVNRSPHPSLPSPNVKWRQFSLTVDCAIILPFASQLDRFPFQIGPGTLNATPSRLMPEPSPEIVAAASLSPLSPIPVSIQNAIQNTVVPNLQHQAATAD